MQTALFTKQFISLGKLFRLCCWGRLYHTPIKSSAKKEKTRHFRVLLVLEKQESEKFKLKKVGSFKF